MALYFDGVGDYVTVSNHANLQFGGGNFTLSAWVKIEGGADWDFVISKHAPAANFYELAANNSGIFTFRIRNNTTKTITGSNIEDDAWHHLIGMRNSGQIEIYLDGVSDATPVAETEGDIDNAEPFYIGRYGAGAGEEMKGIISDVAVWDTNLSSDEITFLAESKIKGAPLQVKTSNLKAYWSLDDIADGVSGNAATFIDMTGNDHDGTGTNTVGRGETELSYQPTVIYSGVAVVLPPVTPISAKSAGRTIGRAFPLHGGI